MSEGRADALRPGHRLHVYGIAEVLGAGGFGITYRAEEEFTHRQVAIKEFLPNSFAFRAGDGVGVRPISQGAGTDFAWGLERFRLEAKTLYSLRHPNIVPVLQYFEANGTGYLVMEYQAGATLGALLKRDITLDPAELDEILEPLLDGLAAIHAKGFLHRDVKPDNIFIRTDGVPLLLDFGAARQAIGARSQSLTTIISEGYAPFEQYESSGNQGPWTDLYAFGATLYRCMTGIKPTPAPSRVMAQMQGGPDPLPRPSTAVRERYRAELLAAVDAAMRVNATARPQSIEAFRALVRESAADEPPNSAETIVASEPAGTIALPDVAPPPVPPPQFKLEPTPRTPPAAPKLPLAPPVRQRPRRNEPVPPVPPPAPPVRQRPPPKQPVEPSAPAQGPEEARAPATVVDRYRRGRVWFIAAWASLALNLLLFALWMASPEAPYRIANLLITVLVPAAIAFAGLFFAGRGRMIAYWGLVFAQFAYFAFTIYIFVLAADRGFHPTAVWPLFVFLSFGWTFVPFLGPSVRAYVRGRREGGERGGAIAPERPAEGTAAERVRLGLVWFIVAWGSFATSLVFLALWAGFDPNFDRGVLPHSFVLAAAATAALVFAMRGSMIAYGGLLFLQFAALFGSAFNFVQVLQRSYGEEFYWSAFILLFFGWTLVPLLGSAARAYVRHRRAAQAARAATVVTPPRAS